MMQLPVLPMPIQLTFALVVLLLDVGMIIYALNDLYLPERRVFGYSKDVWALIIIFGNVIGWFFYLRFGRDIS